MRVSRVLGLSGLLAELANQTKELRSTNKKTTTTTQKKKKKHTHTHTKQINKRNKTKAKKQNTTNNITTTKNTLKTNKQRDWVAPTGSPVPRPGPDLAVPAPDSEEFRAAALLCGL